MKGAMARRASRMDGARRGARLRGGDVVMRARAPSVSEAGSGMVGVWRRPKSERQWAVGSGRAVLVGGGGMQTKLLSLGAPEQRGRAASS